MGSGFVAVGERGALVHARDTSSDALAEATTANVDKDDLFCVRTRGRFVCAGGRDVHVLSLDALGDCATASVPGAIRDVWLGNGFVRVLLDTAAVLEAPITAGL